jgi:4-diphosphocytidyl-2-C-methyl-D-erythritol kinase
MATEAFAPAKVNLALHVTGRREDGYHLLDSLVVFADVGDTVTATPADRISLTVTGPMAADVPTDDNNLVLRAARLAGAHGMAFSLHKCLPTASGIGGGSADAAATLRALSNLTGRSLPPDAATLGADVPVCLAGLAARMRGIGERIEPLPGLPKLDAILVNPGTPMSTPLVFKALVRRDGAPMPDPLPEFTGAAHLTAWLAGQRNDLQEPAIRIAPVVAEVLDAIAAVPDCGLARMSGSGATCFGIFADARAAQSAARVIAAAHPDWWVVPTRLN